MTFDALVDAADDVTREHLGGESVIYNPEVGAAVTVTGIFDEQYRLVDPGNSGVEQVGPAVGLRLEDLPVHPEDDEPTLTIAGNQYSVRERQPGGMGWIILLLYRSDV